MTEGNFYSNRKIGLFYTYNGYSKYTIDEYGDDGSQV